MFTKVTKNVVAFTLILSLALATAVVAPKTATTTSAATKITLSKKKLSLAVGAKAVKLTVKPSSASASWKTSNKQVATVKKGTVTAIGAGTCTITATSGSSKATCKVTVKSAKSGTVIYDLTKEKGINPSNNQSYAPPVVCEYNVFKYKFALWLCMATFYDPANGGKDYRGLKIKCQLTVKNNSPRKVKQLIAQTNNTRPKAYPIVYRIKNLKKGEKRNVTFTFSLPKNAVNTDTDSATGKPYPIMFYFARDIKPTYKPGDKFTFTKCKFTVVG